MKKVADYITESEKKQFCCDCCEICGNQCVIWRKAQMRQNEEEVKEACIK